MRRRSENGPRGTAVTRTEGRTETRLYDADGRLTSDPARAVSGEVVELDAQLRVAHRSWFRIQWMEFRWLQVSEPAFLLWVLALFVAAWVVVSLWLEVF